MEFIASVYEHFNTIIDLTHPSCKKLTADLLQLLLDNKVVLPEEVNRIKNNKVNNEFSKRDPAENAKLLAAFGKIEPKRPPKGFKRTARAEVYDIVTENEVTVAPSEVILQAGAMWAETRALTGAARNILDLSMTGNSPTGGAIDGSLSFFEINEADRAAETNITIEHAGKIYKENTIKFPQGDHANNTWRLQLKGVTDTGETLTSISRPELGRPGGFVNKILLFTKVNPTYYRMDILAPEEQGRLIATSSVWGRNGLQGTSKAYGFIQA